MTTDRELLELAAKAYGLLQNDRPFFHGGLTERVPVAGTAYGVRGWNPLTSDGDALRLVVKLELHIGMESHTVSAWHKNVFGNFQTEQLGTDPCAATRRAIVRAAAEIGRAMP